MLTKEECINALEYLDCLTPGQTGVAALLTIDELIKEHFDNPPKIDGNTSDGYHTFNELYHHRAILFSVICNQNKEIAWKSKQHHDGTMYDGMFIVGIETPLGQYTYHHDIKPYWKMFDVKELENAPKWDGHGPKDIDRLFSINDNPPLKFEELKEKMWVWDNKEKWWRNIVIVFEPCNEYPLGSLKAWANSDETSKDFIEFEENRFYRKQVEE